MDILVAHFPKLALATILVFGSVPKPVNSISNTQLKPDYQAVLAKLGKILAKPKQPSFSDSYTRPKPRPKTVATPPTTNWHFAPARYNPANEARMRQLAAELYSWTGWQWSALQSLMMNESQFDHEVMNGQGSGACGIGQALPCSKYEQAGGYSADQQIRWTLSYILERYGSPANAWAFWNSQFPHWY